MAGVRVLVADDSADSAQMLATLLELTGYDVRAAYSGTDALAAAEAWRPQAVVLDLGMPDLGGLDVAAALRRRDWAAGLVLIAVTGRCSDEDKAACSAAGFDHHVDKPVDVDALCRLLPTVRDG